MSDLTLTCRECGNEFVWTEGEQEFYKQKGLQHPIYCPICRARFKARARQFAPYRKKPSQIKNQEEKERNTP